MKKLFSYILSLAVSLIVIAPPIGYAIPVIGNSSHWLYMVVVSGFFGMLLLTQKLPVVLKLLTVYLFFSAFISQSPFASFNAYVLIVAVFWAFIAFQKINREIFLKCIEAVFWLEVAILLMQVLGKDVLLNFDSTISFKENSSDLIQVVKEDYTHVFLGTVMQYMRVSSVLACLAPLLILRNKLYIIPVVIMALLSQSSSFALAVVGGSFVCLFLGAYKEEKIFVAFYAVFCIVAYAIIDRVSFQVAFTVGRVGVWGDVLKTWCFDTLHARPGYLEGPFNWKYFLFGHGTDTFLPLFPIYKHDMNPFPQAHNCWLQFLWEIGLVGTGILVSYCVLLIRKLYKIREYLLIGGLVCIAINMFFAFPTRMTQTMFLITAFLAFCHYKAWNQNLEETHVRT